MITHDYLETMGVPLLKGRLFNEQDAADAKGRVVINETMARRHWPNEDPIGRRVRISWDAVEDEVIGVVGDVKHTGLDAEPRAMTYWPYARNAYGTMTVTVRTAGDAGRVVSSIVGLVRQLDPELVVANVKTMDEVVSNSVAQRRLTMLLLTIFAGGGAAAGGGRDLRRHRVQRHANARRRSASGWRSVRSVGTCCAWSSGRRSCSPSPGSSSAASARFC